MRDLHLVYKLTITLVVLFIYTSNAMAFQRTSPIGLWQTIDDETGEPKAIVKIFKKGNKLYGAIIDVLNPEKKNNKCTECDDSDPRFNKPILGMEIIKDMVRDGDAYDDGTILDPKNGKVYSCKIELEEGKLNVRGYLGISLIGRSQIWLPYDN